MPPAPDEHDHPHAHSREANYRPDSASIIHAVVTRRDRTGAIKDREAQQREQIERTNLGLLLHALHEIADDAIPPAQRRLVQESEVQRAMAVLKRSALLHAEVRLEHLLSHCEEATVRDRNPVAHLIDPFQLRHVLTFQPESASAAFPAEELHTLERLTEHGPVAEIVGWFARAIGAYPQPPKTLPGALRHVFARSCRAFAPSAHLEALSFEISVLTLRTQGVIGFEDTRLFFSLLKQIGGPTVPALDDYLQSDEVNHATTQHRATGNTATGDYFRAFAHAFDHAKLPALERHLFATIEARNAPPSPAEPAPPSPAPAPASEPRRGLFSSLRNLGQSIISRE
ncbi:MAG TPA: hypothetical protein VK178_11530 [Opitutaceae bacterium]|nr:hypothetical protein [Opitutaceae bacterium]